MITWVKEETDEYGKEKGILSSTELGSVRGYKKTHEQAHMACWTHSGHHSNNYSKPMSESYYMPALKLYDLILRTSLCVGITIIITIL